MKLLRYIANNYVKILLVVGLIFCVLPYQLNDYFNTISEELANRLFFLLLALGYFFTSLSIFLEDKKNGIKYILFSLTLNNLIDEIVNNNTKYLFIEFIVLVIIILLYIKYYACRRNRKVGTTFEGNN